MPPTVTQYAKGIVAIAGAGVTTAMTVWTHNPWLIVVSAMLTAAGVYLTPATGYIAPKDRDLG